MLILASQFIAPLNFFLLFSSLVLSTQLCLKQISIFFCFFQPPFAHFSFLLLLSAFLSFFQLHFCSNELFSYISSCSSDVLHIFLFRFQQTSPVQFEPTLTVQLKMCQFFNTVSVFSAAFNKATQLLLSQCVFARNANFSCF